MYLQLVVHSEKYCKTSDRCHQKNPPPKNHKIPSSEIKAPAGLKFQNYVYMEWFDDAQICIYMLENLLESFCVSFFNGIFWF